MAFLFSATAAAAGGDRAAMVARAHARLLGDKSLQFDYATIPPPPPIPQTPGWLKWLGELLSGLGPILQWIVYGGVALGVLLLLAFLARELLRQRYPQWFAPKRLKEGPARPAEWKPDLTKAKVLLEDADRLAAEGRYAEAAHLLLFRTVEDIDGRRPNLVKPALTSRDIADISSLPEAARAAFRVIVDVVERSFFGGRDVDAGGFAECRRAYEAFIAAGVWA